VLCGDRVCQMTKTYNDVEAVTRLLEEKENDLELAARIGQGLLSRNNALENRLTSVEGELVAAHDTVTQLRHDLLLKGELLQIYTNDLDDSSPVGVRVFGYDVLQRKVKGLEDDNRKLRAEASQLVNDSSESELREEQLLQDVLSQLADANNHIRSLDDDLANKYEESTKQREEISSLLAQLVSQRHKIRELTSENEELLMQLRVVRECQNELASELVDYKEKYSEILGLLHETQDQLKQQNKRSLPTAQSVTSNSILSNPPRILGYNPDSLASELELSSLGSDGWTTSSNFEFSATQNLPKFQFQRVFDTVKCASQTTEVGTTSTLTSTPSTIGHMRMVSSLSAPHIDTSPSVEATQQAREIQFKEPPIYPGTSRIGVPGTPGTVDLLNALSRLKPKVDDSADMNSTPLHGWRTPDSIMSTGSHSVLGSTIPSFQYPEKLKIIKPIEGSTTLHHWLRLATPHLGSLLEERPGVTTRDTEHKAAIDYTRDLLEMYSLFDVEEDEDSGYPGKSFGSPPSIYTFTNSTVMHPDHTTLITSSLASGACMSSVIYNPTCSDESPISVDPSAQSRRDSVSTFSTQLSLAKALQERGTDIPVHRDDTWSWSGLSTPNNSPVRTPFGSQIISYRPLDLIQKGAKILRQTFTGESSETDVPPVPRISKSELEALSKMHLLEKLEKLGLDNVGQKLFGVSPGALQAALSNLAESNCDGDVSLSDEMQSTGVRASIDQLPHQYGILTRNCSAPSDLGAIENGEKCQFGLVSQRSDDANNGLNMIAHIDSPSYSSGHEVRAKIRDGMKIPNNSPSKQKTGHDLPVT